MKVMDYYAGEFDKLSPDEKQQAYAKLGQTADQTQSIMKHYEKQVHENRKNDSKIASEHAPAGIAQYSSAANKPTEFRFYLDAKEIAARVVERTH